MGGKQPRGNERDKHAKARILNAIALLQVMTGLVAPAAAMAATNNSDNNGDNMVQICYSQL